MHMLVHLYPPLNNAAGQSRVEVTLEAGATLRTLLDELVERFGTGVHRCLFDDRGQLITAWCAFINQRPPVHFNQPEAVHTPLADGDEIWILLALAGG